MDYSEAAGRKEHIPETGGGEHSPELDRRQRKRVRIATP